MKLSRTLPALAALVSLAAYAEVSNDAMIGPGLRVRPAYDGADSHRTELVPVIRYFGDLLFVRSTQGVLEGGLRTEVAPGLHLGAQLAYESGRRASESDFLARHNLPDIKRGGSFGLQAEWDHKFGPMPVTLLARARKDFDSALGMQADFRASAGVFQSGPFAAGVFAQAIWANAKSAQAYYGITPAQALTTGLPAYQPGSGLANTSVGLLWSVDLGPKWLAVGSLESRHLRGDAAHSPLAQRATNGYVSAGIAYRL